MPRSCAFQRDPRSAFRVSIPAVCASNALAQQNDIFHSNARFERAPDGALQNLQLATEGPCFHYIKFKFKTRKIATTNNATSCGGDCFHFLGRVYLAAS